MTKSELIDHIAGKQTQLSSKDVELAIKAVLEYMSQVHQNLIYLHGTQVERSLFPEQLCQKAH